MKDSIESEGVSALIMCDPFFLELQRAQPIQFSIASAALRKDRKCVMGTIDGTNTIDRVAAAKEHKKFVKTWRLFDLVCCRSIHLFLSENKNKKFRNLPLPPAEKKVMNSNLLSSIPDPDGAKQYLIQHDLHVIFDDLVRNLILTRPEIPLVFLAKRIEALALEKTGTPLPATYSSTESRGPANDPLVTMSEKCLQDLRVAAAGFQKLEATLKEAQPSPDLTVYPALVDFSREVEKLLGVVDRVVPKSSTNKIFRGRYVLGGSGKDCFSNKGICDAALSICAKPAGPSCNVLYVGTATYDAEASYLTQTSQFREAGCSVQSLPLVGDARLSFGEMSSRVNAADLIVVSGGNTLYAMGTWRMVGLDVLLANARDRGCVLCGGSAGAICWFDGGHSDSGDPVTYRIPGAPSDSWKYIRISGLGFLPGLLCPHHDKTQSNGVLRSLDFDQMLQRHSGETGIGIDHNAALVLPGDGTYRVIVAEGQKGAVTVKNRVTTDAPSIITLAPGQAGQLVDILQAPRDLGIVPDPGEEACRQANPVI